MFGEYITTAGKEFLMMKRESISVQPLTILTARFAKTTALCNYVNGHVVYGCAYIT